MAVRVRAEELDYSDLPDVSELYDWAYLVYGNVKEMIPDDAPKPLGKHVMLMHYIDANLFHDWLTGRALTGILHLLNKMPINWFLKRQATVETVTYGSEFVMARVCTDQVVNLQTMLHYLCVFQLARVTCLEITNQLSPV